MTSLKRLAKRLAMLSLAASLPILCIPQESLPVPELDAPAQEVVAPAVPDKPTKVRIHEGTEVPLLFVDAVSSATNTEGDRFSLKVDGDVKVDGIVVIHSGTIAVGNVVNAKKRGHMGKAGELNIALDHLTVDGERVRLRANKGKTGDAKVGATVALTVLFGPLGLLKRGKDIEIKAGTPITAYVDQEVDLIAAR